VAVDGSHAYIGSSRGGFWAVDVTDPSTPLAVGFCDTPGYAGGVDVDDDLAFVADNVQGGLRVIDITDPTAPFEAGSYNTPGAAQDVAVRGDFAYVADWDGGLRVVDVSDPGVPREEGFCYTPDYAVGVDASADYAFVASYRSGLRVIDITSPGMPFEVGFWDTPGLAFGVTVNDGRAYVADGESGLRVIDITDPSRPRELGSYDTDYAKGVAVRGNLAYVADGWAGLRVVDISDPSAPLGVGYHDTPGQATDVSVVGGHIYVADARGGLTILRFTGTQPPGVGTFEPSGGSGRVREWADFTTTYSDPNGYEDVAWAFFFLDRQPPVTNGGLAAAYNQPANVLWLLGGGLCRPGQARSLSTEYVTLDCSGTSVSGAGDTLTINWRAKPEQCFVGGCGWNYAAEYVTDSIGLRDAGLVGWWRLNEATAGVPGKQAGAAKRGDRGLAVSV
jgi:hypothetical protein